jgi:hypothetical protein
MLSERVLLAAVSLVTDLGNGQEPGKAIRACLVATALAVRPAAERADFGDPREVFPDRAGPGPVPGPGAAGPDGRDAPGRLDGSGYHRGASGGVVPAVARVLAAADAFQGMTQDRPHHRGLAPEAAAAALAEEARAGHLGPRVCPGGGRGGRAAPPRVRTAWPAGLSDREVEVLRLVARGPSNRAAAARFAMEHGLLHD